MDKAIEDTMQDVIKQQYKDNPPDTDERYVLYIIDACSTEQCKFRFGQICRHPDCANAFILIRRGDSFPSFCPWKKVKDIAKEQ